MTSAAISKLIPNYLTDLEGGDGSWRGMRDEVQVFVLSDDTHDRMRIMAPIGELEELDPALMQRLLEANYDRALDAKYAMRGKEVWSVSVHPLATLAPDDFAGFIEQVVRLAKNTGTTFASSDLVFGGGHGGPENGDGEDAEDEADDDKAPDDDDDEGSTLR